MTTQYQYKRIVFIQNSQIFSMNQAAKNWDPDIGGDKTFGNLQLSSTGQEPSTYSACGTSATFQMKNQIDGFDNRPQVAVYDGDIWTWQAALDDMGLQVIQGDII